MKGSTSNIISCFKRLVLAPGFGFAVLLLFFSLGMGELIKRTVNNSPLIERNRLAWQIEAEDLAAELAMELKLLLAHPKETPERLYVTGNLYLGLGEKLTPQKRRHFLEQYSRYYGDNLVGHHKTLRDLALILNFPQAIKLDSSLKQAFLNYKNALDSEQKNWLEKQYLAPVRIIANCWGISVLYLQSRINDRRYPSPEEFAQRQQHAIKFFWQRVFKLRINSLKTLTEYNRLLYGLKTWKVQDLVDWLWENQLPKKITNHCYLEKLLNWLRNAPVLQDWCKNSGELLRYHRANARLNKALTYGYFALPQNNIPENGWLIQLLQNRIRNLLISDAVKEVEHAWQEQFIKSDAKLMMRCYPFDKRSKCMVNNGIFNKYFRPNGILEQFFKDYLDRWIITTPFFRYCNWLDGEVLNFPQRWLTLKMKMALLQKLFFPNGAKCLQLQVAWLPLDWPDRAMDIKVQKLFSNTKDGLSLTNYRSFTWDAKSPIIFELESQGKIVNSVKITNFAEGLYWLEQHFSFKSYGELNFKLHNYVFTGLLKTPLADAKVWEVLHHFWR